MVKNIIIGVVITLVFVVGGYGAFLVLTNPNGDNPSSNSEASATTYKFIDACDVLTEKVAKQYISGDIQKISASSGSASTKDITVTNCNYGTKLGSDDTSTAPKVSAASLMIRVAKSATGAQSNKTQFSSRDAASKTVTGIGDDAFYNSSFHQLNVLKGNNWYIITAYKNSFAAGSLESNTQLANKLSFR